MRAAEQLAVAELWLAKAKTDLALARVILKRGPDMEPWAAGFHAQQAAEKSMKAVPVAEGIEPPRDHNLVALKSMLPADLNLGVSMKTLASLSAMARGVRYVTELGDPDEPTWTEAEEAVAGAQTIMDATAAKVSGK
jgi:HEPN domain-containing protein